MSANLRCRYRGLVVSEGDPEPSALLFSVRPRVFLFLKTSSPTNTPNRTGMPPFLTQVLCDHGLGNSVGFAVLTDRSTRSERSGNSITTRELVKGPPAERTVRMVAMSLAYGSRSRNKPSVYVWSCASAEVSLDVSRASFVDAIASHGFSCPCLQTLPISMLGRKPRVPRATVPVEPTVMCCISASTIASKTSWKSSRLAAMRGTSKLQAGSATATSNWANR
jgi:hypothetical protein